PVSNRGFFLMQNVPPAPVATYRHTAILLLILAAVSYAGSRTLHTDRADNSRLAVYFTAFIAEWALFWYVYMGLRRKGISVTELIGERWSSPRNVGIAVVAAVALFFIGNYAIELCARLFHLRTI